MNDPVDRPRAGGTGVARMRLAASAAMALLMLAVSPAAMAEDKAVIDRAQIIGNRELPKVLYIVPWKKPAPDDLSARPLESVLDEVLAPVDRDVFRRQVRYDGQVQSRNPAPPSAATK